MKTCLLAKPFCEDLGDGMGKKMEHRRASGVLSQSVLKSEAGDQWLYGMLDEWGCEVGPQIPIQVALCINKGVIDVQVSICGCIVMACIQGGYAEGQSPGQKSDVESKMVSS